MTDLPFLSLVIWLPIIGGMIVLAAHNAGDNLVRWISLAISVLVFLVSIPLYTLFDTATHEMQFTETASWIPAFNISYALGVDGISMPLILLTTFFTVIVVIAGWEVIKDRVALYMASFLIMEGMMNGVFAALDGVLFYVFWEA
ncbi:MAG TPA: NADH-quinone oxidoreductase subunit M, partial [Oceanospirillales bacterium]|nr:NADH-quinone oxidoreductase subunit M [Oceanospirillales bacterium]